MRKSWDQFLQALARGEEIDGGNFSTQAVTGGVTGQFSPGAGILSVFGNGAGNDIEVSRDAAGGLPVGFGMCALKISMCAFHRSASARQ